MAYKLTISLAKADVSSEVDKTSSYMGARTVAKDGGDLYDNISASDEDAEMLERFWNEACHTLTGIGKEFLSSAGDDDGTFSVEYAMPDRYNPTMDGSAAQVAFSYAVYYILSKWLAVCGMDGMAQAHGQMAAAFLQRLESIIYTRVSVRAPEGGEGGNTLGDKVESFGNPDGDGSEEAEGGNTLGDKVESFGGSDGDGSEEAEGGNTLGDKVESFGGSDGDGSEEAEGGNVIGGIFPQGFGPTAARRYTWR